MIQWQKSTFSGGAEGNECVELACANDKLLLRESDDPAQVLALTCGGLAALLQQIRTARP
ncbi:DUF397 domain-containing protein [Streptomyces sp. NBC_01381]|uniref:DUF397 domain-containing protein n=1 Tax=Streptomyces sp. NBC_01381 TaxID=2903845 RepID=UPI00224F1544|nr:DUF397 domain-containing protein [Streptomyces sp. NBC_01381]MCX4666224.1 DUF397 domain-containing protein [Streptomyces sp. NBC_01381]